MKCTYPFTATRSITITKSSFIQLKRRLCLQRYYHASTSSSTYSTTTTLLYPNLSNKKNHYGTSTLTSLSSSSSSSSSSDELSSMTKLERKYMSTTSTTNEQQQQVPLRLLGNGGYSRPVIQWYPGHIAKAERALRETMKAIDVLIEVRDARIPIATAHPTITNEQWCTNKPRIIVLTHIDSIPRLALNAWYNTLLQANQLDNNKNSIRTTPSGNITKSTRLLDNINKNNNNDNQLSSSTTTLSPNQLIQDYTSKVETVRIQYNTKTGLDTATNEDPKQLSKKRHPTTTTIKRSSLSLSSTMKHLNQQHNQRNTTAKAILFVNAKMGVGIHGLTRAILSSGQYIQERRMKRGLLNRPLRVGIIGYPNVGKSALINKLIGRKRCSTANIPGVTRSLQWIRVKHNNDKNTASGSASSTSSSTSSNKRTQHEFELLDSPGIIPAVLADQSDAMLLAACHCIGEASYDNQVVAAYLCEWILAIHTLQYHKIVAPLWRNKCIERYKFDPIRMLMKQNMTNTAKNIDNNGDYSSNNQNRFTGEDMLYIVADNTCQGDPEDAARKILQDFRAGRMGPICLQVAPSTTIPTTNTNKNKNSDTAESIENSNRQRMIEECKEIMNDPDDIVWQIQKQQRQLEQQQRSIMALKTIQERGIVLPSPIITGSLQSNNNDENNNTLIASNTTDPKTTTSVSPITPASIIGKGIFDGW